MQTRAKQEKIQTPTRLADNLIGSLGGLTAVDRVELRRQVAMLINHSYALGYAAGSSVGFMTRIRSRLARIRRAFGQDMKMMFSAFSELLTISFRIHKLRSRKTLAPVLVIQYPGQYPMRGAMITEGNPVIYFHNNLPAALLAPPGDWRSRNQMGQQGPNQARPWMTEGFYSQSRITRELPRAAVLPNFYAKKTAGQ